MFKKLWCSIFCGVFFLLATVHAAIPLVETDVSSNELFDSPNDARHYAFEVRLFTPNTRSCLPVINFDRELNDLQVSTLYGDFTVNEPVLIALFNCDALLRLTGIHQYGFVSYLTPWAHTAYYSRYVHSVGVWALLRRFRASLEEQIIGLLHDVSHTVFSHVGDYLYNHSASVRGTSYQDAIHPQFLRKMGVDQILVEYGYDLDALLQRPCLMLDQKSPEVCADRLEYTLQAGLLNNCINEDDVNQILEKLKFDFKRQRWIFCDSAAARQFAEISLYTTEHVVGAAWNHILYSWMADALREGLNKREHDGERVLGTRLIHEGSDLDVWEILNKSKNKTIKKALRKIKKYASGRIEKREELIHVCVDEYEPYDIVVHTKFRGIDPLFDDGLTVKHLTECDPEFAAEFARVQKIIEDGWRVKFVGELEGVPQNISTVIS